jgi:pilus assembly protein CpaB
MTRNRLALIGLVAMALAAFVSLSIYRVLTGAVKSGQATALTTVVAAANDLPAGSKLNESDLRLVKMPHNDLPPGSFTSVSEVVGRAVTTPIMKGAPVMLGQLANPNAGAGLPALIPSGMRAVSVKVNDVISVAGFVTAGTRVDVLLTGQPNQGGGSTGNDPAATTVLENIQVLAAGQKLQHNGQGDPQQVTVITLLVSPEDAQKLALATQEGKIQLALRNPLDEDKTAMNAIRNSQLYHVGRPTTTLAATPVKTARPSQKPPVVKVAAKAPYAVEIIEGPKRITTTFDQKDAE